MEAQILNVSSKGEIMLPASFCQSLSLNSGDKLLTYIMGDTIVLKAIQKTSAEELKDKLDQMQQWAAAVGYTADDVSDAIKTVRSRKHNENRN